jgi:hypothetical protein
VNRSWRNIGLRALKNWAWICRSDGVFPLAAPEAIIPRSRVIADRRERREIRNGARDLCAAAHRRLDGIGEVFISITDDAQVEDIDVARGISKLENELRGRLFARNQRALS